MASMKAWAMPTLPSCAWATSPISKQYGDEVDCSTLTSLVFLKELVLRGQASRLASERTEVNWLSHQVGKGLFHPSKVVCSPHKNQDGDERGERNHRPRTG